MSGEKGANLAPKVRMWGGGGSANWGVRRRQLEGVSVGGKLSFPLFIRQLRLQSSDDRLVNDVLEEGGDAVDEFDAQAQLFPSRFYLA